MKITYELDLNRFEAWSGAIYNLNRIKKAEKTEEFEMILEDIYPDGLGETELNDILWFETDWINEMLRLKEEEEEEA